MAKKWMQRVRKAIERAGTEGAFRRYCIRKGYKGVTQECIQEGLRSPNPAIRERASLARTFLRFNPNK